MPPLLKQPFFVALTFLFAFPNCTSSKQSSYYYYNLLCFPLGLDPLCWSANITTSRENGAVFITIFQTAKYKVLDNLNKTDYARKFIRLVDASLLGEPQAAILSRLISATCLECEVSNNLCYFFNGYMADPTPNCKSFITAIPNEWSSNLTALGNLRRALQEGFRAERDSSCGEDYMVKTGGSCGYMNVERKIGSIVIGSSFRRRKMLRNIMKLKGKDERTLQHYLDSKIKILDENEQTEMQFMNEVQTVGKIHHQNLVCLLSFYFEQSRRAL
ncbi:hypothetical protein MRB53_022875 [Persea americana]|uniref:Uncharacterized protein n=1 Tax=Persea americana TaxID=3435 RepID=A0ACC2L8X5_PERAE|nr:hypothetical protein MRB53_022875 [Persea americana]